MRAFTGLTVKPGARLGRQLASGVTFGTSSAAVEQTRRESSAVIEDAQEQATKEATARLSRSISRERRAREAAVVDLEAVQAAVAERSLRVTTPRPAPSAPSSPTIARVAEAVSLRSLPRPVTTTDPAELDPPVRRALTELNLRRGL